MFQKNLASKGILGNADDKNDKKTKDNDALTGFPNRAKARNSLFLAGFGMGAFKRLNSVKTEMSNNSLVNNNKDEKDPKSIKRTYKRMQSAKVEKTEQIDELSETSEKDEKEEKEKRKEPKEKIKYI